MRNPLVQLAVLAVIGGGMLPRPAWAGCAEVFFACDLGDREPDGATVWRNMNLEKLRSMRWPESKIAKKCRVAYSDPPGCNWRGGVAPTGGGGGTIVISNSAGYGAPAAPAAAAGTPAVRRDAWGKRTPTPAPERNPAPPRDDPPAGKNDLSNLPDDGPYAVEIAQAAARYHLPVHLVRAVMMVESGGNPNVQSNKGAIGLMQLLPATAKALGVDDVHDPAQNIMGGARFLRVLANKFEGDLVKVLSGYHAGSMRVASRDATPFAATDDYVRKVLKIYYQLRDAALRGSEI
ncbi:MAG: lytic transglycosylase domain-containing protein [Deltaproteobacteria bacterium]|nr:lytic transglycosylase domain-containing protein [Deltaproteobacteria bacterium]